MPQQHMPRHNMNLPSQDAAKQEKPAVAAAKPIPSKAWATTETASTDASEIAMSRPTNQDASTPHPLLQRQYRSLHWPLQMGQSIKSPNFSQQQCKCNKRQLGDEQAALPVVQMR